VTLLGDLQTQVKRLCEDLRERSEQEQFDATLRAEHTAAAHPPEPATARTALSYLAWREDRIVQAAVAWVLSTVFVRYCEDNDLVELPWIAGPGDRLELAVERAEERARSHPEQTDRDWLEAAFQGLADSPVAAGLFDRAHNPLWTITPSHEGAKELLAFWRRRTPEGALVHDFTNWPTRLLGELYQELSEHAKDTYALLQTPEFVERFILDLTLDPAIEEFGLAGLRVIDPTCGSGHFLLGVFHRLLERWRVAAPGINDWELIRRSLDSVHGVDKNPFAAAIARFRLIIEAMQAGGVKRLDAPVEFRVHVAIGDSLLHGREAIGVQDSLFEQPHHYVTEDVEDYIKSVDILGRNSYDVVVGNPPYITVKDKAENRNYRLGYETCAGTYALSVPFAERFFKLAKRAGGDRRGAGYVGQITANSFMKREFGQKLITTFFGQKVELTHVIDSSGAHIPGHPTPTVILVGRNQIPRESLPVHAVLGKRAEPGQPREPAKGLVWRAIIRQYNDLGSESEWVSSTALDRSRLRRHPWSLSGGGASVVMEEIESQSTRPLLRRLARKIGFASFPGQDDVFFVGTPWLRRFDVDPRLRRQLVVGEVVRDWGEHCTDEALVPYDSTQSPVPYDSSSTWGKHLWTQRRILASTTDFDGETRDAGNDPWWTWYRWVADRYRTALTISFAEVATHNHFALDRGGAVLNRTAPVIKLPESATEGDHQALVAVLNSSTACFWLKQMCHDKGGSGLGRGVQDEAWEGRYQFNGTKVELLPMPPTLPLDLGRMLDQLAQELDRVEPSAICSRGVPTREQLDEASKEHHRLRMRMIALQEELDWECYRRYGLLTEAEAADLLADPADLPELALGERAFEIALGRAGNVGEVETQWFARHGSVPITEIPRGWSPGYREVVRRRIEIISLRRDIALIERPECKRRWQAESWEVKERHALQGWLLDRCETRELWYRNRDGQMVPRLLTVNQLADVLRNDPDFVAVAQLMAVHLKMLDADLAAILKEITADEHVPFLAALRYKDSGLRKRAEWEEVWERQREEDRTGQRLEIAVPQKYTSADFVKASYWRNRGKLDVPKERFISYPGANPDGDGSLLLGWAGWDHAEQADALSGLITVRSETDNWGTERIVPLLAGLVEVMPWVWQWHNEDDQGWGSTPAQDFQAFLDDQRQRHGVTEEYLRRWRPGPAPRGGGRRRSRRGSRS
jgi:hypothetical protein